MDAMKNASLHHYVLAFNPCANRCLSRIEYLFTSGLTCALLGSRQHRGSNPTSSGHLASLFTTTGYISQVVSEIRASRSVTFEVDFCTALGLETGHVLYYQHASRSILTGIPLEFTLL